MRYLHFGIEHFKGITKTELDLSSNRIVTLVGLNESGKTTILESIATFYEYIKTGSLPPNKLNDIRPKGINFTGSIKLKALLSLDKDDKLKIADFHKSKGKKTTLLIPDKFEYTVAFQFKTHAYIDTTRTCGFDIRTSTSKTGLYSTDKAYWQEIVQYVKSDLIPEVLFYEDFIFEIPEKVIFHKPYIATPDTDVDNERNKQWQLVLTDILRAVDPELKSFQEYVVDIWDKDNDTARNRVSSMEDLLNKKITEGWKALFEKKTRGKNSQKLNFKEIRLVPSPDGVKLHVSFKVRNDSGKEFQINERSKGFKWFFSFLIFTEFRKNRTKNILFLLDEPASNLHSSAQHKILEAIEQLSDGSVVVYSTHSHHLIEPTWLSGAYVVVNDSISEDKLLGHFTEDIGAHKITAIKYYNFVSDSGSSTKTVLFQPILDRLDYAPSQLEPIPEITITEGKFDWYTYKYFFEIILKSKADLNLYPGPGCEQHWDIIRLYLSWGKSFVLILDSDKPGIKAQTRYVEEFSNFVSDSIFTYSDVFKKEIVTEDLISDTTRKILIDTAFGKGSYDIALRDQAALKSKLNYAILQLLNAKQIVKIDKATSDNFVKLLAFIKKAHSKNQKSL